MNRLWLDARLAIRGFRRSPTFTVSAILILSLGIGMAVAMWGVFAAVLVRPLPIVAQDDVMVPRTLDAAGTDLPFTIAEVNDLRADSRTMSDVAAFAHFNSYTYPLGDGDQSVVLHQAPVSTGFFRLLGVRPALGRMLQPTDDSTSHLMVLSYRAWQRQFGGDPAVIGHRLRNMTENWSYTIVGVAPPGLDFPIGADCWIPLFNSQLYLDVVARLRPNVTPAVARADFFAVARAVDARRGGGSLHVARADVRPISDVVVGGARSVLVVLIAAVLLLLLIACVNVGNLLLLRAANRSREIAMRRALGATSRDVLRQLVTESAVLAAVGGALGLVCALVALRALRALSPAQLPRTDAISLGLTPFAAAAALSVTVTVLCGALPAFATVRVHLSRTGTTRRRQHVRQVLVASQVALALMMLAGAALLVRSLQQLEQLDLGYQPEHLSIIELTLPANRLNFKEPAKAFATYDAVAPGVAALPGVRAMTPITLSPFHGANVYTAIWQAEGQTDEEAKTDPQIALEVGGPDYFRTLGISLLRGRGFLASDREDAPPVVILSQATARRFWPNQNPVGKRIKFAGDTIWYTVVGLARDIHFRSMRDATPTVFMPWRQFWWTGAIAVRTTTSAAALAPAIRDVLRHTDPNVTLWRVRTMDDYLAEPLAQPRMSALLLSVFGLVALALAAIGLYGVMASAVREQTRDIGIRMALGAAPAQVRHEVLRRAMLVSLGGAAVGIIGALAASRLIASLLFEVSPTDPIALLGACGVLLGVAAIAAYLPALTASRVDPARALQAEQ